MLPLNVCLPPADRQSCQSYVNSCYLWQHTRPSHSDTSLSWQRHWQAYAVFGTRQDLAAHAAWEHDSKTQTYCRNFVRNRSHLDLDNGVALVILLACCCVTPAEVGNGRLDCLANKRDVSCHCKPHLNRIAVCVERLRTQF